MYTAILLLHIILGAGALFSGMAAILSSKGGRRHNTAGRIFYYCMYGTGASALVMTLLKFNPFLLAIALFSVYLSYSGRKAISYWRLKETYTPCLRDRVPYYIALATAIFMILYPVVPMLQAHRFSVPVLSVFGLIMLVLSLRDIQTHADSTHFRPRNKGWLFMHIGKMSGAFIATVTAFLVNNIHIQPPWLTWLLPTAIGVPLIFLSIRKWDAKLSRGNR